MARREQLELLCGILLRSIKDIAAVSNLWNCKLDDIGWRTNTRHYCHIGISISIK